MLEARQLFATVSVNAQQPIKTIATPLNGVNLASWQYEQNTTQMKQAVQSAGLQLFRLPGGSAADGWHLTDAPPYNGYNTTPVMANFVQSEGGNAVVTVDYGSGSPQEAAAMLAYLNAPVGSTVAIGNGQTWSTTANAWVTQNFQTAGYWASLRAAKPLAKDDGLNFLRVNHAAPWGFTYYEVGNEEYATWETDHHSSTGVGGSSPTNYITFAKQFSTLAAQIDPNAKIGIDVSPALEYNMPDPTWTADLLTQSAAQGFTPGFLSDHIYVTGLTDQNLLLHSVNDPNFRQDNYLSSWANRDNFYRVLLTQKLGTAGAGVQLMATEFNDDINTKQADNLVGGLWTADALGGLLQTDYTAGIYWDLTNGYDPLSAPDTTHYGWRQGIDEGLISTGNGPAPASGAYVPYPSYFAEQLFSKIDLAGGQVLPVTSSDANLSVYAVKETDGHIHLLVINKNATSATTGTFSFAGFSPASTATQYQYGIAEDNAQSQTTNGQASLSTAVLSGISVAGLTQSFPAYSMSVIDLAPAVTPAWLSASPGASYSLSATTNTLTILSGTITLLSDASVTNPGLAIDVVGGKVIANTTEHLGPLTIGAGASFAVASGGGKVLRVTGLSIDPAGTLDLANNDLIYDYSGTTPQAATIAALIRSARGTGAWTGDGLTSSAAAADTTHSTTLGFMEATDYKSIYGATATFDGEALDTTAVIVKYTLYGDADLDGGVSINDFNRLATDFGAASGQTWLNGDFDDDGGVSINDFNLLAANFGKSLSATGTINASTAVVKLTPPTPVTSPTPVVIPPAAGTGSIIGTAFNDNNNDAKYDTGDGASKGITVFLDTNNNGILDAGEVSTTTDSNGKFTFANLGAGTYHVRRVFDATHTYSTPLIDVTLTNGQAVQHLLLGTKTGTPSVTPVIPPVTPPVIPPTNGTASITGTAFNDNNSDGSYDTGDGASKGIVVFLDTNNDGILDDGELSTTTDTNGRFTFSGLTAGTYHVRRVMPKGYVYSTPLLNVTLTPNQVQKNLSLGTKKN